MAAHQREVLRFEPFELDLGNQQLRRNGRAVRLERKPMDLLLLLARRSGELVSRAEIVSELWGDVFVDTDVAVNTAVRKIRQALNDSPDAPRFIETVPGRGYRFIARASGEVPTRDSPLVLAVLPFENLGLGVDRDYIADGFTEEAIAALGQVAPQRMQVIGRTSVMPYKGVRRTIGDVGRELGASHLLEGSVRAENSHYRITCKLIRVSDQVQLWSMSYDALPTSMLEFQRELCRAVAAQIRIQVASDRMSALEARRSADVEAWDFYLRGRHFWNQLTPATSRQAVECYTRATQLDPGFGLAWSGLADAYSSSAITSDAPPRALQTLAGEAAQRAVVSSPELAEAHTSVGFVNFFLTWDWPAAEGAYRRAIAIDPGYALAHRMLSVVLSFMGRHDEAAPSMRQARELDPLYPMHHALSAQTAFLAGDYTAGEAFARQASVLGPEFWIGYFQMAQNLERAGREAQALEVLASGERFNRNSKLVSLRGYILAKLGQVDAARDILRTLEGIGAERYMPPYALALVYAGLNERAAVYEWLERALDARDVHLIYLPVDPKWDPFRSDAAFQAIVRKCGFQPLTSAAS